MSNDRLRHKLQIQTIQIEQVLARQRLPARVAGGRVGPHATHFHLQGHVAAGWERLRQLKDGLSAALRAPDIHIELDEDLMNLQVFHPQPHPVDLLDLQASLPALAPLTAVLGLAEGDQPLLLDFQAPDMAHLLLAGGPAAGKTALLRTLALSLALANRQSQLQLLVICGRRARPLPASLLQPLAYLPHLLAPLIDTVEEAEEALRFLCQEMAYRRQQGSARPLILALVDHAVTLLDQGGAPLQEAMTDLIQNGPAAGIHLVLSTRQPAATVLDSYLRPYFTIRLVGRVADEATAYAAAGLRGSQAQHLRGQGDFVAVSNDALVYFQSAFVADHDFHHRLDRLHRQRPAALLAQPAAALPTFRRDDPHIHDFVVDESGLPTLLDEGQDEPF